jgi:hypothetical protein
LIEVFKTVKGSFSFVFTLDFFKIASTHQIRGQ